MLPFFTNRQTPAHEIFVFVWTGIPPKLIMTIHEQYAETERKPMHPC